MAALSAEPSSGKSRNTSLALPVSIHSVLILGRISFSKAAQCGQVSEAYSMMVTGASALPRMRSSAVTCGASDCATWRMGAAASSAWALPGCAARSGAMVAEINQIFRITVSNLLDVDARQSRQPLQERAARRLLAADNGASEAFQRRAQAGIGDAAEAVVKRRSLRRRERAGRWRPLRRRRRSTLDQGQPDHRAIAEIAVDALEQDGLAVLDLQCQRRGDAQPQRAVAALAAREGQLDRPAIASEVVADDRRPLLQQLGLAESLLAEHRLGYARQAGTRRGRARSEEHTSELQSHSDLVCRLLLEKKKKKI